MDDTEIHVTVLRQLGRQMEEGHHALAKNAIRYALRTIEERRELLAALKWFVGTGWCDCDGCGVGGACKYDVHRDLIAKCEAP